MEMCVNVWGPMCDEAHVGVRGQAQMLVHAFCIL